MTGELITRKSTEYVQRYCYTLCELRSKQRQEGLENISTLRCGLIFQGFEHLNLHLASVGIKVIQIRVEVNPAETRLQWSVSICRWLLPKSYYRVKPYFKMTHLSY